MISVAIVTRRLRESSSGIYPGLHSYIPGQQKNGKKPGQNGRTGEAGKDGWITP
jgi:hypothetical protein